MPSETWGSLPDDDEIFVPQIEIMEHEQLITILQQYINPLGQTANYGIDLFENTVAFVEHLLNIV